jgi:DMSO/TMAO reductase YedYZ molybdopterin-dependent catalytic subunit
MTTKGITTKLDRRMFMTGAVGLALSGCDDIASSKPGAAALDAASQLTYEAQERLRTDKLAQEYPSSAISTFFKANGSIDPKDPAYKKLAAEQFASFSMPVEGLVEKPRAFTLDELKALPARTQITRHDCVEGWSCIAQWTGVPLRHVLDIVKPKPEARFVVFHCFDRYETDYTTESVAPDGLDAGGPTFYGSIGMADALHPQTILAYAMNGAPLPVSHGAPVRVRVERQLGYKMTKYIRSIEIVDSFESLGQGKGGYWEDQGYEWYGGI